MTHDFLVGAVFVALVLAPCAVALLSRANDSGSSPESDVKEDGFI